MKVREKAKLLDMLGDPDEPLCPELEACLNDGPLGPMIHHPLVHWITCFPAALANRALREKRKQLERATRHGDWHSYVFTHERPYRLEALLRLIEGDQIGFDAIGALMAEIWTDSENIHQYLDQWALLFRQYATSGSMMNTEEWIALAQLLPERLTLYRGNCNDGGWSWTLDLDTARFFAERSTHAGDGTVSRAYLEKRHVLAYLTRRGEEEIIVEHKAYLTNVQTQPASYDWSHEDLT